MGSSILGLHTGGLVEHTLDVVDTLTDLQNLLGGVLGAAGGVEQLGVLGSTQCE